MNNAISGYVQLKDDQVSLNSFPNPIPTGAEIWMWQAFSFDYADEDHLENRSKSM